MVVTAMWFLCAASEDPPEEVVDVVVTPQVIAHATAMLASDARRGSPECNALAAFLHEITTNHTHDTRMHQIPGILPLANQSSDGEAATTTTGLDLLLQGLDAPVPACVLGRLVELLSRLVDGHDEVREAVVSNERAMSTLNSPEFKATVGPQVEEFLLLLSLRGQSRRSSDSAYIAYSPPELLLNEWPFVFS